MNVIAAIHPTDALRVALIALDDVVALTAIGGGLALVFGLEAERFGPCSLGLPKRALMSRTMLALRAEHGTARNGYEPASS